MIALARSEWLTRFLQSRPRIAAIAGQFVGGADEEAAIRTALRLHGRGIRASLFFLGEYITDAAFARQSVDSLARILGALDNHGLDTHVSVDPSQIGYSISDELGDESARRLAAAYPAQRSPQSVLMVDMEDHTFVDRTLRMRNLLAGLGVPAAITLQAYLRRTEADMARVIGESVPCVRLVKGAFAEGSQIAWTRRHEITAAFLRLTEQILSPEARARGLFPVFATHDEPLIHEIIARARRHGWEAGEYEFEMLYGVRPELQQQVLAVGEQLRLYLPYGTYWWPYTVRRIGENPRNVAFVWRALLGPRGMN